GFDQGLSNIIPSRGQAGGQLPYPDGRFDAAYLVTVFGEIPDPGVALRELHRVLRPGGRLAVGEVILDPDYTSLRELRSRAEPGEEARQCLRRPLHAGGHEHRVVAPQMGADLEGGAHTVGRQRVAVVVGVAPELDDLRHAR